MFCKRCSTSFHGTQCPACGEKINLIKRSEELDTLMNKQSHRLQKDEKTYQDGLAEGYDNGRKTGMEEGYHVGYSEAINTILPAPVPKKRTYRKVYLRYFVSFLLGAVVFAVLCNWLGYQAGYSNGRSDALSIARKAFPIEYYRGLENGKLIGNEEGGLGPDKEQMNDSVLFEMENATYDGTEGETNSIPNLVHAEDHETEILFSRKNNSGTWEAPSDDVKQIQKRLIEMGYLKDQIDGVFGSKTEYAVNLFQQKSGLPVTGEIDQSTYELMFLEELTSSQEQKAYDLQEDSVNNDFFIEDHAETQWTSVPANERE